MPNLFLGFPVSKAAFAEVAGAVATVLDLTKTIVYITSFDSLDGFDIPVSGSGVITLDHNQVTLSTGATGGSSVLIGKSMAWPYGTLTWAKQRKLKLRPQVTIANDSAPNVKICTGYPGAATRGFGFIFEKTKVRGILANNTGPEYADLITGLSPPWTGFWTLEAVWTPASKVEFYVDGVLKGTLSTKLPTGTSEADTVFFAQADNTDNLEHKIELSQVLFQQAL